MAPTHKVRTQGSTSLVQQSTDPLGARFGSGHVQAPRVDVLPHAVRRVKAVVHGGGDDPSGTRLQPATAIETWGNQCHKITSNSIESIVIQWQTH